MRHVLSSRAGRPLHRQDVPVESGQGLGHRGHLLRPGRELPDCGPPIWPVMHQGRSRPGRSALWLRREKLRANTASSLGSVPAAPSTTLCGLRTRKKQSTAGRHSSAEARMSLCQQGAVTATGTMIKHNGLLDEVSNERLRRVCSRFCSAQCGQCEAALSSTAKASTASAPGSPNRLKNRRRSAQALASVAKWSTVTLQRKGPRRLVIEAHSPSLTRGPRTFARFASGPKCEPVR
jgi:hypothetical protein